MPAAPVEVDWEIGADERLRKVVAPRHHRTRRRTGRTPCTSRSRGSCRRATTGTASRAAAQQSPVGRTRTAPARARRRSASRSRSRRASTTSKVTSRLIARWRSRRARSRRPRRRLHLRKPRHDAACARTITPECYTLEDYRRRYALYKSDPDLRPRTRRRLAARRPTITRSRTTTPASTRVRAIRASCFSRGARPHIRRTTSTSRSRAGSCRSRVSSARTRAAASAISSTVLMLDGRQYRSPQACGPEPLVEPCPELYAGQRTMLGDAQEQWLAPALGASRRAGTCSASRRCSRTSIRAATVLSSTEPMAGTATPPRARGSRGSRAAQNEQPRHLQRRHPRVPRQRRQRRGRKIPSRRSWRRSS